MFRWPGPSDKVDDLLEAGVFLFFWVGNIISHWHRPDRIAKENNFSYLQLALGPVEDPTTVHSTGNDTPVV